MGLLDRVERALDRLINTGFARTFKSGLVPAEIAAAIRRECDVTVVQAERGQLIAANDYVVQLAPTDHALLSPQWAALSNQLTADLLAHVRGQRYLLAGPPNIRLEASEELPVGICRVLGLAVLAGRPSTPKTSTGSATVSWVEVEGVRITLSAPVTLIGRGSEAAIRLAAPAVSTRHAEIRLGTPTVIADLGSTNGTLVDGRRAAIAELRDGSRITLGGCTIIFHAGDFSPQRGRSEPME